MTKKIRVLVVDDSALMRKMIPQILGTDPEIEVVGTAMDGLFALKKIADIRPDVITLDVSMPRMDGIQTLRHVVEEFGIPAIMVSSLTKSHAELTLKALELGAFDFVTKPQDAISVHINDIGYELIEKVKQAHRSPVAKLKLKSTRTPAPVKKPGKDDSVSSKQRTSAETVLAIGASTGGPNALGYLMPFFPENFPAAIVIVQHMPEGFTEMFASRLNSISALEVKEAMDGDILSPGRALVAPGNRHLRVRKMTLGNIAMISTAPPVNSHRPSVDVLFESVAQEYGAKATALIMTGMGSDGADGIGRIKAAGGGTYAQDEKSCIVFGMPRIAIERGYVDRVISLEELGPFLINQFMGKEKRYDTARG